MKMGDLQIKSSGVVTSEGSDGGGKFKVSGKYEKDKEHAIELTKQYIGKHKIIFKGTFDTSTMTISGLWNFPNDKPVNKFSFKRRYG